MWIGIESDIGAMLDRADIAMEPEDTLLLYTDGITESVKKGLPIGDDDEEFFGDDRLLDIFTKYSGSSSEEIKDGVLTELNEYDCRDDITVVVLRRT